MSKLRQIDRERLMVFTDALIAIIMTLLILDIKVPVVDYKDDKGLWLQLSPQLPHFVGFIFSFAFIAMLWFRHHTIMETIQHPDRTFAVINFLFVGAIATMPFSTAMASEYPQSSLAVGILAGNTFILFCFISILILYAERKKLSDVSIIPAGYVKAKKILGITGTLILLAAIFVAIPSPLVALGLIGLVALMQSVPLPYK